MPAEGRPWPSDDDDDDDDDKDDDDCLLQDDISTSSSSKPTLTHHPRPPSLTLILERAGARCDNKEQDEGEEGDEHLGLVVVGVGSADSLHAVVRARGN